MVGRAKNTNEVEYHVLHYLINGESATCKDLASLALKMKAGVDENGKPIDPVAHKRFVKGVDNVKGQLTRLLLQRERKLEGKQ